MSQKAKIRVCARCERVYLGIRECPVCGFASYGAIWAIGFWRSMLGLLTKQHNRN